MAPDCEAQYDVTMMVQEVVPGTRHTKIDVMVPPRSQAWIAKQPGVVDLEAAMNSVLQAAASAVNPQSLTLLQIKAPGGRATPSMFNVHPPPPHGHQLPLPTQVDKSRMLSLYLLKSAQQEAACSLSVASVKIGFRLTPQSPDTTSFRLQLPMRSALTWQVHASGCKNVWNVPDDSWRLCPWPEPHALDKHVLEGMHQTGAAGHLF